MRWLVRIGIGDDANWSMAWEEVVDGPSSDRQMNFLQAKAHALRAAEVAVERCCKLAPTIQEPTIEIGPPFLAAFSARIKSGRPHLVEATAGPQDAKVDARGIAIAAAKLAAQSVAHMLAGRIALHPAFVNRSLPWRAVE